MKYNILKRFSKMFLVGTIFATMGCTSYAWDCNKDGTGTHALIVTQAVNMIENDLSNKEPVKVKSNLKILKRHLRDLQLGSTYPDYDPNAYDLYQDHFFDPDTKNNFTIDNSWYLGPAIYDTAESQIRKFAIDAKNEWIKGNYKEATFLLGQGLHYLGDLNAPYHAANITAVDSTGHVKYETYVEKRKEKYAINSMNYKTDKGIYKESLENKNYHNWMNKTSVDYAKVSKKLYYSSSTMKHSTKDWDYSATKAMYNSQEYAAAYIYRFINEVSGTIVDDNNTERLDEFNVIINTHDEKYAGTNDYLYFGFETFNGEKYEWILDNAGNDFEKGQKDNYILKLKDKSYVNFNNISKFWIKKSDSLLNSDDWKVKNIKVISKSKVILEKNINKIIKGNEVYYINI